MERVFKSTGKFGPQGELMKPWQPPKGGQNPFQLAPSNQQNLYHVTSSVKQDKILSRLAQPTTPTSQTAQTRPPRSEPQRQPADDISTPRGPRTSANQKLQTRKILDFAPESPPQKTTARPIEVFKGLLESADDDDDGFGQ